MKILIKGLFSGLGTTFIYLFGGWDIALQSLLLFIVIDYATGMMKSYKSKVLNSNKGIQGIFKKLGMLCMVAVACVVDRLAGDTGLIRTTLIYYLVANEGLSIIENLGAMDIIIPDFLKEKLEQLSKGSDD